MPRLAMAIPKSFGIPFSPPKKVNTKKGPRLVSVGPPNKEFWDVWRNDREHLIKEGFKIRKVKGTYQVQHWSDSEGKDLYKDTPSGELPLKVEPTVPKSLASKIKASSEDRKPNKEKEFDRWLQTPAGKAWAKRYRIAIKRLRALAFGGIEIVGHIIRYREDGADLCWDLGDGLTCTLRLMKGDVCMASTKQVGKRGKFLLYGMKPYDSINTSNESKRPV